MSCQRNASRIVVPDNLRDILLEFTISYLLEQPEDIIDYAVDFFTRLRDNRENQIISSGQTCSSTPDDSVEDGRFRVLLLFLWGRKCGLIEVNGGFFRFLLLRAYFHLDREFEISMS